ncbi:glucose 1-dehydrogenase [Amycolatopsis acidicola]|uniref:Glucose 1-dehydrogenase n=1 Tax=Amycolatopsis acidicola TaxID=2596893 RepID=A0A5N0V1B6_9PSEU
MSRLTGKVAVVTGGASGIGAGSCTRFVAEGARVVISDVDDERGETLAAELGEAAVFRHTDVTKEDEVAAAVQYAVDTWGSLDVMFNNAGRVGPWTFIEDTTEAEWDTAFAVLCRSAFFGIKHAAKVMREQGRGSIISTSSVGAIRSGYGPHPYSAAKAALLGLTRSVAVELAPHGVRVNALIPGGVATRIVGRGAGLDGAALDASVERMRAGIADMQPIPRAGEPADLAAAAVFLASDDSSYYTGQELVVDGGVTLGRAWPAATMKTAEKAAAKRRA